MKKFIFIFLILFISICYCEIYENAETEDFYMGTIDLVTAPTGGAPLTTDDYDAQNNYLTALLLSKDKNTLHLTEWDTVDVPLIADGTYIWHGGALYIVNGDTDISGSASSGRNYIKLVISGSTLVPSWVSSASGYSWNYAYSGFYDGSSNQLIDYVVYLDGTDYYKFDRTYAIDKYDIESNLIILEKIDIGNWNMYVTGGGSAALQKIVSLNSFSFPSSKLKSIKPEILNDSATTLRSLNYYNSFLSSVGGYWQVQYSLNNIALNVLTGSAFDSTAYNDNVVNRGYIIGFFEI